MRHKGFTLIELTLVVTIIVALIGLSIPLFRQTFNNLTAKDAVFNISKLVSYARERAVIDKKNYKAVFDFNHRTYQLMEFSGYSGDKASYKKARGQFGRMFALPKSLFFYDPKTGISEKKEEVFKKEIIFYPDGRCNELLIDIVDSRGSGYSITLKGFGGFPQIKEVTGEV
ncbi:MAG: prepilin-type N-terminal cleavage/methylation domain-containing protein [Candidatus Omnitrophota bacterium]